MDSIDEDKRIELLNERSVSALRNYIHSHVDILRALIEARDKDGLSHISQKRLASQFRCSQARISKYLRRLQEFGAIRFVAPSVYCVLNERYIENPLSILKEGPLGNMMKIVSLIDRQIKTKEEWMDYKAQAESLNISYHEVQRAWGYLSYFFGKP